jgi:hypothetical protein
MGPDPNLSQALTAGGGTFNGSFNIDPFLPNTGNYANPLNILSATLSLYGYSSPQATQVLNSYSSAQTYAGSFQYSYYYYQGSSFYYYNCGWGGCYSAAYTTGGVGYGPITDNTYTDTVTNLDNTTDTASITAGADTFTASDNTHTVTNQGTTTSYSYSSYGGGYSYNGYNYSYGIPFSYYSGPTYRYDYLNATTTINDSIYGSLQTTDSLSAASIAQLSQLGILNFSVLAASGQFNLTEVSLVVTLDQSTTVPEPGTLSVFGFGLLLLALRARQIRRPDANE